MTGEVPWQLAYLALGRSRSRCERRGAYAIPAIARSMLSSEEVTGYGFVQGCLLSVAAASA